MTAIDTVNSGLRFLDLAEDSALTVPEPARRACALGWTGIAAAVIDAGRARRLLDSAETVVKGAASHLREEALVAIAAGFCRMDPPRTDKILRKLGDQGRQSLVDVIVTTIGASEPARAEAYCKALRKEPHRFSALAALVGQVTQPSTRDQLTADVEQWAAVHTLDTAPVIAALGASFAESDPARARRILARAESMVGHEVGRVAKVEALSSIAEAYAPIDRRKARTLLDEALKLTEDIGIFLGDLAGDRSAAFYAIDVAMASLDAAEAYGNAMRIKNDETRAMAQAGIAYKSLDSDLNQAEEYAKGIDDARWRSVAFALMARALLVDS